MHVRGLGKEVHAHCHIHGIQLNKSHTYRIGARHGSSSIEGRFVSLSLVIGPGHSGMLVMHYTAPEHELVAQIARRGSTGRVAGGGRRVAWALAAGRASGAVCGGRHGALRCVGGAEWRAVRPADDKRGGERRGEGRGEARWRCWRRCSISSGERRRPSRRSAAEKKSRRSFLLSSSKSTVPEPAECTAEGRHPENRSIARRPTESVVRAPQWAREKGTLRGRSGCAQGWSRVRALWEVSSAIPSRSRLAKRASRVGTSHATHCAARARRISSFEISPSPF